MPLELADALSWLGLTGPGVQSILQAALYAIAVGSIMTLFLHRSERVGYRLQVVLPAALVCFAAGIVGSRLFYLLEAARILHTPPRTWFGLQGTASWGAYGGVTLALVLVLRRARVPRLPAFDVAASCMGLGIAIGRLACFVNGDDFGRATTLPWAIHYPSGSEAYLAQVGAGLLPPQALHSLGSHPLQLYLALNGLIMFACTSLVWRRFRTSPGVTLVAFLAAYGGTRFFLEFLRDPAAGGSAALSTSQWMCLALVGTLFSLFIRQRLIQPRARACPAYPATSRFST